MDVSGESHLDLVRPAVLLPSPMLACQQTAGCCLRLLLVLARHASGCFWCWLAMPCTALMLFAIPRSRWRTC